MAIPSESKIVNIYHTDPEEEQLEQIDEITPNDRVPVVDAETNDIKNASVSQITKGLDTNELVVKLQGVQIYDENKTITVSKDTKIQINGGRTITIASGAPASGVGTKLCVMAKDAAGTVICQDGGNNYTIPAGKYIELIYTIGGWTFYSQMVSLTLAEYEALGDSVNSDNIVYAITDDEDSMGSNPTVESLNVGTTIICNGKITSNGGLDVTGVLSVNRKNGTTVGENSTTEGFDGTASGAYSHAEGYQTSATKGSSHSEGQGTSATGIGSHAEGVGSEASQNAAHAEGNTSVASGRYSHAEGNGCTSSGTGAHAEGSASEASGNYSHAEGYNTVADDMAMHAAGQCNKTKTGVARVTGWGEIDAEKDIEILDTNGNLKVAGDMYAGLKADGSADKIAKESMVNNALANYRKVTIYTCKLNDFSKVEDFINSLPITSNKDYVKRWGKLIDDKITAGISNYLGKFINESNGYFYGTLCMGANATYFSLKVFSYNTNQEVQFRATNTEWIIILFD